MHVTTITLSFLGYFQDSHLREMCANSIHQIVSLVYDLLLSACLIQRKKKESSSHQFKYPQWTNLVLKVVMGKHCLQNWNLSLILSYQPFHSGHINVMGLKNMISSFWLNNNGLLLQAEIKLFWKLFRLQQVWFQRVKRLIREVK